MKWNVEGGSLSAAKTSAGQGNGVANHVVVTNLVARLLSKLVPDVEPITEVAVNALATNLNINGLNQSVANIVDPAEAVWAITRDLNLRQSYLKIDTVNQITIARNSAGDLLTEVGIAINDIPLLSEYF